MNLEYNVTTDQNGAQFSYPGGGGCLLIFAGLVGLGILGYEYFQFDGVWPGWGRLEGLDYVLLGIGCTFTTAGLSFYFNGTADPHTIIFDNTRYVVRIEQKGRSVVIPYQDIAGFSRRTESSSSSGSTQTYYDYVVYWYKKAGSVWDIKTVSKAEKAVELIDQLNQAIDLQTEGLKNISLEVPRPVQSDGKTNSPPSTCSFLSSPYV